MSAGGQLTGQAAIVTGAGQGIGRAIALALGEAGAAVGVVDRTSVKAEAVVAELTARGARGLALECDVSRRAEVDAAVLTVLREYGRLDVLVNNAHDLRDVQRSFAETTEEHLRRNLDSGLFGAFYFLQACRAALCERGGAVINVASPTGMTGTETFFSYAVTKEALRAGTRVLAREWGPDGVRVNTLAPSAWDTPSMRAWADEQGGEAAAAAYAQTIPLRRVGQSDDVAAAALFLAGDGARFITGHTLMVDGGLAMDAGR
jgi:NAD(P)-dependent dehydrogenase (short-subunit alcohol dehydrogenase family)